MTTDSRTPVAHASGTFALGGDLPVHRLGYGAMRITGPGVWGDPPDRAAAIALLRRVVELGVDFIDTADSYGPFVSEDLIREALHPYTGVVIATKGGLTRSGPDHWAPVGNPYYLRQCVEMSLRRLGVECIDLYQLHRIDAMVPLADQLGALKGLQEQGKIRHIGVSQVSADELAACREVVDVASVQNLYNVADRHSEAVLDVCTADGIGFIPWFPVAAGPLARPDGPLGAISARTGIPAAQLSLAWLLHRSPVMLPIPGTSCLAHLEENCAAAGVVLDEDVHAELAALADPTEEPEVEIDRT
jgi:aryl-alcohol dehydrogenase-like predicted oxidoreductase